MKRFGSVFTAAVLMTVLFMTITVPESAHAEAVVYEYAYVRQMPDYGIYYLFDMDTMTVKQFKTNEPTVLVGTFTGTMQTGLDIRYRRDWHESFRLKDPPDMLWAILTDYSGFTFEYMLTDPMAAGMTLAAGGYAEIRME